MARGGRYVTAGALTGSEVKLDLCRLYGGQFSVIGSTSGRRADLERLTAMVEKGVIYTFIYKFHKGLDKLGEVIKTFRDVARMGKVAVEV